MASIHSLISLSLLLLLLLLLPSTISSSNDINYTNENEEEEHYYELDNPIPKLRSRSGFFLANIIKKGANCGHTHIKVCDGASANKGKSMLFCCKTHCRNVLGDRNNCGVCGHKCNFGESCCDGKCTVVLSNPHHCGKCGRQCRKGVKCDNGYCGYA
ncbi:protein GRIM REAPER [Humulus lupulus]|uniref:protein GRIM REAPER n=1 Tax=Humulus lupulus TaxID=3486 RepID=UPI002B40C3DA|nr:protein GRIM REAPER [Humulus lupulus]